MKIAVFGATGKTGRLVIDQALDAGDQVVAYARRPEALEPREALTIVGGTLTEADQQRVTDALRGVDAVVVALGPTSLRNVTVMQTALPVITTAMREAGVSRIAVLSAFGVGAQSKLANPVARIGFGTILRDAYKDHWLAETKLAASGLRWTTVHPGLLKDGPRTGTVRAVDVATMPPVKGAPSANRADVAAALLAAIHDDQAVGKQLFLR